MIDFLKSKELAKIKELEQTLERYRENDRNQHKEIKRLEQFELKYKILEQYLNDDEAIIELLECHEHKKNKEKLSDHDNYKREMAIRQMSGIAAAQSSVGLFGGAGMGLTGSSLFN